LAKKLRESTRELEHKLSEHEAEVEELQQRVEDLKTELAAARREEKELKVKEASTSPRYHIF
jgi:chromosome segregation ATPase